jgi:cytoplasmic iron level regulating protein YaaA (DUF328/UPF0246 family)
MQILLANAKMMHSPSEVKAEPLSEPLFQSVANVLAQEMSRMEVDELALQLGCNRKIAAENWLRYNNFMASHRVPALIAYDGQAYKHLRAETLSDEAIGFLQKHLWVTCFLYGLLRPMDGIVPYRMEHTVVLEATGDKPVNQFWRDRLTDVLISSIRADDGVLVHLSTAEYERLFHWKRICNEVKVVQPLFHVRKNGRLTTQAVWAKACRGAMVRYIAENHISNPTELMAFQYEGFVFCQAESTDAILRFVRDTDI